MSSLFSRAYPIRVIAGSLVLDSTRTPADPDGIRVEVELPEGVSLSEEIPADELGIPLDLHNIDIALKERSNLTLPTQFHEPLRAALGPLTPDEPVWLEFRRPFGYLPTIPWERLLQPALGAPLLRLPFSAVPAVSGTDPLHLALCAPAAGTSALQEFLRRVVPRLPMHVHIHVFAARDVARLDMPVGLDVTLHDPPDTLDDRLPPPGLSNEQGVPAELENPWLRWMVETISPESVDVVHFFCPGMLSRNFGMLDFGNSPTGADSSKGLRVVNAGQILSCTTQLGAWSLAFTSPGSGEAGLRLLAHRMSGLISGPVVLHVRAGGNTEDLVATYRFLYSALPVPPPTTSDVAITCHPAWLRRTPTAGRATAKEEALGLEIANAMHDCTLDKGTVRQELRGPLEPPAWLAGNQRLLERWTSGVISTEADPAASRATSGGVTAALQFISSAIEDAVRKRGGSR